MGKKFSVESEEINRMVDEIINYLKKSQKREVEDSVFNKFKELYKEFVRLECRVDEVEKKLDDFMKEMNLRLSVITASLRKLKGKK
ncbi:MAG: hypothetical protein ACTSR0_04110 [Candidatus Asgardarchaeia archaeon]